MGIGHALSYGGTVAGIGMLIVFLGLTILIVCVSIMGGIFRKIDKNKADKVVEAPAPIAAPAVVAPVTEEPVGEEVTDPAIIAVISAAIAAYDNSGNGLVVRKVRRRPGGWKSVSRAEQVYRF